MTACFPSFHVRESRANDGASSPSITITPPGGFRAVISDGPPRAIFRPAAKTIERRTLGASRS